MSIRMALVGNPNCGKTTMFNAMTGANQYVGNWPGVTVEKKEGKLKGHPDVTVTDLPGIYSLSPYTLEEVVSRNYLLHERPDVILNLVDATNLERNLYLTTQVLELGMPVVVALNMMDVVKKRGDQINSAKLSEKLGCPVIEVSALRGTGLKELYHKAMEVASLKAPFRPVHTFQTRVEQALETIENSLSGQVEESQLRWYAIKLFEQDEKVLAELRTKMDLPAVIQETTAACEEDLDDDSESIITNERYQYITSIIGSVVKKARTGLTTSDRIDQIITNRILALPIFVVVMALVYAIAMGSWTVSIGTHATDWANDGLFGDGWFVPFTADTEAWEEESDAYKEATTVIEGFLAAADKAGVDTSAFAAAREEGTVDDAMVQALAAQTADLTTDVYFYDDETGVTTTETVDLSHFEEALTVEEPDPNEYGTWVPGIPVLVENLLTALNCNQVVSGLVLDGIVKGVGSVLGFVPQMLVLFFLLALLEDCGYMARVAFIMDRIFRRFGLSGKSFIPMLVATGCGVPGIMASRTIEQDRDRKMTIMTTAFIPCGAKMPIIALFAGALFGGGAWVATSAYFIGVAAVIISGVMLKKFKAFAGEPAPFVMELPAYHVPTRGNVLRATWERGWSFIKRAGTVILLSSIILWFLQGFGFTADGFGMVADNNDSLLATIGKSVAFLFAPLGFGTWQATVATVTGLIAKEEVVSTFGVTFPGNLSLEMAEHFTPIAAYAFMIFNLLCAPCFAAMGAIKREMNNPKWTLAAIGYMCGFAYVAALIVYQLGGLVLGEVSFGAGTVAAVAALAGILYLLVRKGYRPGEQELSSARRSVSQI